VQRTRPEHRPSGQHRPATGPARPENRHNRASSECRCSRNHAIVRSRPSRKPTAASQPSSSFARSVANALGAQLEVYSLILLRDAFKQLSAFEEPIEVAGHWNDVFSMIADSLGALGLFIIANGFSRLQRHRPITRSATSQQRFVNIKKMVCLALLGILAWLLIYDAYSIATTGRPLRLFDIFFTTLVFVDVLVALISLGFSRSHPVVFRNFGFALVAVLLRLALASDAFYRPALGVGAGIVAVGITLAYNEAIRALHQEEGPAAVEES